MGRPVLRIGQRLQPKLLVKYPSVLPGPSYPPLEWNFDSKRKRDESANVEKYHNILSDKFDLVWSGDYKAAIEHGYGQPTS